MNFKAIVTTLLILGSATLITLPSLADTPTPDIYPQPTCLEGDAVYNPPDCKPKVKNEPICAGINGCKPNPNLPENPQKKQPDPNPTPNRFLKQN